MRRDRSPRDVEPRFASRGRDRAAVAVWDAPPGGLVLESVDAVRRQAARIHAQSVRSKVMPLGNKTGMTAAERTLLGRWIKQGLPD